jgi:hypothetical protein
LIEAEVTKLKLNPPPSVTSLPTAKKRKAASDDEEDDEVKAFKKRPKAVINKPMVVPLLDKSRKQAIDLAMAQINPNASFSERVAHFDHMAAIAQKRKS